MRVRIYKYKTSGIYELDRGFISNEIANRWYKFWGYVYANNKIPNDERGVYFWRILHKNVSCDNLVATGGSIYLHPMDGCGVVQTTNDVMTDAVYAELCHLMNACVKYIGNGASVEMYTSKIKTIKE